jgi:hypothetical protein
MQNIDNWPRTIQANIYRFYERIIQPATQNALIHDEIVTGFAPDLDTFQDRAKAQVDNYTANEANKVYAFVLIALFERYLRLWATALLGGTDVDTKRGDLLVLLDTVAAKLDIDLVTKNLRATFQEALLVGNVVRHGEGTSMEKVRLSAPHLIDRTKRQYVDLIDQRTPDSEWVRIGPQDLERYIQAMIRFWGLADKQPNAVTSYFMNG